MQRAAARRPGRFERPRRRLQANLAQLLFAVAGLGLGLLLPRVTVAPTVASSRVTDALVGVGFGVLGLVSIIFSLLFAFRLLADIGLRALSPAVNDPATAVQVLDTIQGRLVPLASRDLDVTEIADDAGAVKVVLALPSWDDYLRIAVDDFIESGSRSPMVLLRARALLAGLVDAAPPQRRSPVTWRLQRAEELAAGNFPLIWRHAAGADPA
jgi:hypothetical protein